MTSPRVTIASRLFPPEVGAGAFRLGALAKGLVRGGFAVRVVTTTPPAHAPRAADARGVDVVRWPVLRDRGGNVRGYLQYASYDGPLALRLLFEPADLIVAESPPTTGLVTAVVCALRRRPYVYYAADVWTDGVSSMGAAAPVVALMRWMERVSLRRAARVISVSDQVTERLVELGARASRVVTVGNGIDTEIFSPDVAVPAAAADAPYFVYTGTMSEWQQPDVFIRAFRAIADDHPTLRVKFFGQGVVKDDLERLAAEIVPGRVDFGGVVSPAESAGWIRGAVASLVSIVPGIGYDFARPTKTYAAAAVGTPVLFAGPDEGGRLVSENSLGIAVDMDVEAVAAAMRALLADVASGERDALIDSRAQWAASNVSLAAVADRVSHAVSQVLRERATKVKGARRRSAVRRKTRS